MFVISRPHRDQEIALPASLYECECRIAVLTGEVQHITEQLNDPWKERERGNDYPRWRRAASATHADKVKELGVLKAWRDDHARRGNDPATAADLLLRLYLQPDDKGVRYAVAAFLREREML